MMFILLKKKKNECNCAHNYNPKQNSLHGNNVLDSIRHAFVDNEIHN